MWRRHGVRWMAMMCALGMSLLLAQSTAEDPPTPQSNVGAAKNKATASTQTGRVSSSKGTTPRKAASTAVKPKILTEHQVAHVVKKAGFPASLVPVMVCTAKYESSFFTAARNRNRNGTRDTGLFQINDIWLKPCQVRRKDLLNPRENARCAYKVWREQGLRAWYAFQKREEECRGFTLSAKRLSPRN